MANSITTRGQRFRKLTELFVTGKAVAMPDGTHLWVQAINDFERDEALNDAQLTRARIILALKNDGQERVKVAGRLAEMGRDRLITEIVRSKLEAKAGEMIEEMRADPEWKERIEIVINTDWDDAATAPVEEEILYMAQVNKDVLAELERREKNESDFTERRLERMTDDDLIEEWVDEWLERRGSERATAEYRLAEVALATRYCDAKVHDDELDHAPCQGHRERVFDSKNAARDMPNELQSLLRAALDEINVAGRDPKDSGSPQASSATPPSPSEPEASTASTSTDEPATPPGT